MQPERDAFEALRRLLVLKKYEQPPPGYFNGFSQQVILRIQSGEATSEIPFLAWLRSPITWVQELWDSLESRPALAGAFGFAVCATLASGLYFSDKAMPITAVMTVDSPSALAAIPSVGHSTNGVMRASASSLFDEYRRVDSAERVQVVNWRGGN